MKKLLFIAGILLLSSNLANAQVQRIIGRSGDIEETTTTTTTTNPQGETITTTTKTRKVPCDGTYQKEYCAELVDNGQTDPVKGRSYTLEIIRGRGNLIYTGYISEYFIDDASNKGGRGISVFRFVE